LPRKRDIEAAIAAHNDTDRPKQTLLPPEAARLLAALFPRAPVFSGTMGSILAKGFDARTVRPLLRSLVAAGFLTKDPGRQGSTPTYHLHLPPLVRR
jgi:hypothetical protein